MPIISDYGFDERLKALSAIYPDLLTGRVISQEKGTYRVIGDFGEKTASVSGKFRFNAKTASDFPAVGDFVMLNISDDGNQGVIHHLLPRKSVFIRRAAGTGKNEQVVAANIDILFICMSMNNDFNLRRLERYITIAWDSGAVPVIVLTKADLCENVSERLSQAEEVAAGTDIIAVSSLSEDGVSKVLPYITPGKTIGLIGSSGVGKSTLINKLLGEDILETGGLRNDDKGRHTTTHRELILLPYGGMVIDTPGMREMGMWDATVGLDKAFSDIEELFPSCRFSNCTHTGEPGCAVKAAIKNGTLSEERWQSYKKLLTENAYNENSESYLAQKERKFKEIARINKSINKKRT